MKNPGRFATATTGLIVVLSLSFTLFAKARIAVVASYSAVLGPAPSVLQDQSQNNHLLSKLGRIAAVQRQMDSTTAEPELKSSFQFGFDGPSAYRSPVFFHATDDFALEAWVKPATADHTQIVALNGDDSHNGYGILILNGKWVMLFGGVCIGTSQAPVLTGKWQHVVIIRHRGVASLCVNGVPYLELSQDPHPPAGEFVIGGGPDHASEQFVGEIAAVELLTFSSTDAKDSIFQHLQINPKILARPAYHRKEPYGSAPFINTWLVAGPFPTETKNFPIAALQPARDGQVKGKTWRYFDDRLFSRNYDDYQDLRSYFHILRHEVTAARYALAAVYIYSRSAQAGQLRMGADENCEAYLNTNLVARSSVPTPDRDTTKVNIALQQGWNRLLLKVGNTRPGMLGFYARICDDYGDALPGVTYSPGRPQRLPKITTGGMAVIQTANMPAAWRQWPYVGLDPLGSLDASLIPDIHVMAYASDFSFTATGGQPPYVWSLTDGTLPPGLHLQPDGTITGTVAESAPLKKYVFTVRVLDSQGHLDKKRLSIVVSERPNRWYEEARLVALIHRPECIPPDGYNAFAELMQRQGYRLGMAISWGNGETIYRWPCKPFDPHNSLGNILEPLKQALSSHGIRFGMYFGNLIPSAFGGKDGAILMPEDAMERFHPAALWFDWAGWNAYSPDALFSMIRTIDPATVIVMNGMATRHLGNGDWDVACEEGWGAWGSNMWGAWPSHLNYPKVFTPSSWRLITDPDFMYSRGAKPDWQDYLRVQIALIGEGYVANIDHSATILGKNGTFEGRLHALSNSTLMRTHMKMANWASPPNIPPLCTSYTEVNPGPLPAAPWGYNTINIPGNTIYLHITRNPRGKTGLPKSKSLAVGPIKAKVREVVWMNKNQPLNFTQKADALSISLAGVAADPIDTIIEIKLDGTLN